MRTLLFIARSQHVGFLHLMKDWLLFGMGLHLLSESASDSRCLNFRGRKVRTPVSTVLVNDQALYGFGNKTQGDGKCNRKHTADGKVTFTGKGEPEV